MAIPLALGGAVRWNFAKGAPFEVGQFEILEHDIDEFLERDVGFVIIDPGAIAGPAISFTLAFLAGLANHLSGPRLAIALAYARGIVAVYEAVFLDPAQGNLDYLIFVFADD